MNNQEENKGSLLFSTVTPTIMLEIKEDEIITGKESPEYELSVEENKEELIREMADIFSTLEDRVISNKYEPDKICCNVSDARFKVSILFHKYIEAIKQAESEKVAIEIFEDLMVRTEHVVIGEPVIYADVVVELKDKYIEKG